MIALEVDVPGIPPNPNMTRRLHRMAGARIRKEFRYWSKLAAQSAIADSGHADDFPLERARVEATFFFKTKRRRDVDNLVASLKPLLDGLVDAGVLVDDDQSRLSLAAPEVRVTAGNRVGRYEGVRLFVVEVTVGDDDSRIGPRADRKTGGLDA